MNKSQMKIYDLIDYAESLETNDVKIKEIIEELKYRKPAVPSFDIVDNEICICCPSCGNVLDTSRDDDDEYSVVYCRNCGQANLILKGD